MKNLIVLLLAAPLLLLGCRSMDPNGVYKGDQVLYNADMAISTSFDVVHTFVKWEYDNKAVLTQMPQLHEYANSLRVQYPTWHKAAMAARNAYASSATKENATALQMAIDVLREAMRQANQWFANAGQHMLEVK